MSSEKALLEFRWSNPKHLPEIAGTTNGLKRLASAASRAAAEGRATLSDDGGTTVELLRDEELKPLLTKERNPWALLGAAFAFYCVIGVLAMIGAYTAWEWLFSST